MQAAIYGLAGPRLDADETRFFADANPAGYILFRRNIEDLGGRIRIASSTRGCQFVLQIPVAAAVAA